MESKLGHAHVEKMKGPPLDRTKVVVRHLPPSISQSNLVDHVDSRFSGRYRWLTFHPGKFSLKHLTYSRACIDFHKPEDVIEFAEFFNGHVFVNEKGTQFKTIVEYSPSQRVPKQWPRKDGREGTILKDSEYLKFLDFIAKPVENLPSAEIQLERKEAERAGAPKNVPVVTPLMDYVRQKRAAKGGGPRTILSSGKSTRRVGGMPSRSLASGSSKRGSGKRTPTTMYVLRESSEGLSSKDKSTYLLASRKYGQQIGNKPVNLAALSGSDALEGETGGSGSTEIGKTKILLLKGKEKEVANVSGSSLMQQTIATPDRNMLIAAPVKQNQRREASGRTIRSILVNSDTRPYQPSAGSHSDLQIHSSNLNRERKPPRPPSVGAPEDKTVNNDFHVRHPIKQERRTRNKDRPDRGVWTPLRRSDGLHASDESLPSSTSQTSQVTGSELGTHTDMKHEMLVTHGGSHKQGRRRGTAYSIKDADGSSAVEGKPSKRESSGYGSHEKQAWVQKSSTGS